MFRTVVTTALVIAFVSLTIGAGASAQAIVLTLDECDQPEPMAKLVQMAYGESARFEGIVPKEQADARIELWASTEMGTWTVVFTYDGTSCLLASGRQWQGTLLSKKEYLALYPPLPSVHEMGNVTRRLSESFGRREPAAGVVVRKGGKVFQLPVPLSTARASS